MGRGTHNQMTCWVPYGDVPYELGGLMVLEKSHKRLDILKKYAYRDVDVYCKNKKEDLAKVENGEWVFSGTLSHNPPAIRNKFGHKWLVADYKAGDLLTFNMLTVHAALDNRVPDSLRLSSDSRYQKASEPIDERWVGENPPGHGPDGKVGLIC
jgi:ectoine hydroxylase-related dioxygenase (phytanoyl-CoA dioxygenase family)